jgi:hypothetical protein
MLNAAQDNNLPVKVGRVGLLGFALFFMILDREWGFIYTHTVFASNVMVYIAFLLMLLLFLRVGMKYNFGNWTYLSAWWTPYLLYTMLGFFLRFTLQNFTYWFCCLILILIATKAWLTKALPLKLMFWSGIVAAIGVFVQLLYPNFYNANISPLFLKEDVISMWTEGSGLNGFTYQLGETATILIYAEVVVLCMREKLFTLFGKRKILYFLIIALLVICIFLTGKRTLSAVSLLLPVIVVLMSKQSSVGKFFILFFAVVSAFFVLRYFTGNLTELGETRFASRFVLSYSDVQAGEDISSGRTYLYSLAIDAFKAKPIFGIGVGKFPQYSGTGTDVHNAYLQVLCEQGIIGFILYIIPLIVSLFYTHKLYHRVPQQEKKYMLLSFSFQIVHVLNALTENCNLGSSIMIYFMGIAIAIYEETMLKVYKRINITQLITDENPIHNS